MDFLDNLGLDRLGGDGAKKGVLLATLVSMLQDRGGLSSLVGMFERAGLADIVQSWIGGGANRPVSPAQIIAAMGPSGGNILGDLASKVGFGERETADQLSDVLPKAVDLLSPEGAVPDGPLGDLAKSALGKLFG